MTDVWLTQDLPFLQVVRAAEEEAEAGDYIRLETIGLKAGIDFDLAKKLCLRLGRAGYLYYKPLDSAGGLITAMVEGLTESRRAVGQWPTDDPWAFLVELLSQQIEDEQDEAKKGKLIRFRDAVLTGGREVITSVLTEMAKQQMGM